MAEKKSFLRGLRKTLIILLIIITLPILTLGIFHFMTRQDAREYLPSQGGIYVEAESVKELYDSVIDLEAMEIVLADMGGVYHSVMEFKSSEFAQGWLFSYLLQMEAWLTLLPEDSPVIIIDPGIKSYAVRLLPLIQRIAPIEDLTLSNKEYMGNSFMEITIKEDVWYLAMEHNILLLGNSVENLHKALMAKEENTGIQVYKELSGLKKKSEKDPTLSLFLRTSDITEGLRGSDPLTDTLLDKIEFPSLSYVSFSFLKENISIQANTPLKALDDVLENFLSYDASPLGVIGYLPDNANIYTSVNFSSFKDLYNLFLSVQGAEGEDVLRAYNTLISLLLRVSSEDLLFNWTGSEAGLYSVATSSEPIMFVKVKDNKKLNSILDSLNSSMILEIDESLVLDGVRVNKMKLNPLAQRLAGLAAGRIELPYYVIMGDYLFLSLDPEALARSGNKWKEGELLLNDDTYKKITREFPKNANLFFYYDLNTSIPRFLSGDTLVNRLIKQYEKGVISLYYTADEVKINLSARGEKSRDTALFPGYPKKIPEEVSSPLFNLSFNKGGLDNLLYLTNDNNLVLTDINTTELARISMPSDSMIVPVEGEEFFFVVEKNGTIHKLNKELEDISPFPVITDCKGTFPPVAKEGNLYLYSFKSRVIRVFDYNGNETSIEAPKRIIASPAVKDGNIYFYPKSLTGTVYALNRDGKALENWPKIAGGVSFNGPVITEEGYVLFLTQKGILSLWSPDGEEKQIELGGVYYAAPVIFKEGRKERIAVISLDGRLTTLSQKGDILTEKQIFSRQSREYRLTSEDFNSDGNEELFVYGGSNYIYGCNSDIELIEGFPVKGSYKPVFADMNSDGIKELLSTSYDNSIYAYKIKH